MATVSPWLGRGAPRRDRQSAAGLRSPAGAWEWALHPAAREAYFGVCRGTVVSEPVVLYEERDSVAVVTLNRPHRLNAISRGLQEELHQFMDEVEGSDDLKVLVITGAPRPDGRPCFSAGGDTRATTSAAAEELRSPFCGRGETLVPWAM